MPSLHHDTTSAAGASPEQRELQRQERAAPRPDIEGIAARAEAATPGPWHIRPGLGGGFVPEFDVVQSVKRCVAPYNWAHELSITIKFSRASNGAMWPANAAHIAGLDPPTVQQWCAYTLRLEAALRQILDDPNDLPPVERLVRIHRVAEQALGVAR